MANLIDTSYFINEIELANASAQGEIETDVNNSIAIYEREVLIDLLGYPLYKELLASGFVDGDASKWDKLVNGEEFTFSFEGETITTKWEGLRGFSKKSLIAYFVYFMHRKKRASYSDGLSVEVSPDTENSVKDDIHSKLVYIWNEFVKMYGDSCAEGQHENSYPSAYNYLLAKTANFPTWDFTSQGGELNSFGI